MDSSSYFYDIMNSVILFDTHFLIVSSCMLFFYVKCLEFYVIELCFFHILVISRCRIPKYRQTAKMEVSSRNMLEPLRHVQCNFYASHPQEVLPSLLRLKLSLAVSWRCTPPVPD